jgi:hypothetical protein
MPAGKLPLMVDRNPLLGTWKLQSYVVTTAARERLTPYGESPTGYLSYTADGRMYADRMTIFLVLVTHWSDGIPVPQDAAPHTH